jgi:hypothetical protein
MSKRVGTQDDSEPSVQRRRIAAGAPLLLEWSAVANEDPLTKIAHAGSWQELFQFDPSEGPQDPEGQEAAVRYKRKQLMLAAHPDKGPPHESALRHAAMTTINRLFAEAAQTWMPPASEACRHGGGTALPAPESLGALPGPAAHAAAALVGKRVRLGGLSSPELNGEYGEGRGVSTDGARVTVQVDGVDALKNILPEKLEVVHPSFVKGGVIELLDLLASAVDREGRPKQPELLHSENLSAYTGFARAKMLKENAVFEAMAANRCVSAEVIATRTAENCRKRMRGGAYHDFGLISFAVVRYDEAGGRTAQYVEKADPVSGSARRLPMFYVLDGQHRLTTMLELMDPETWVGLPDEARHRHALDAENIHFQISVKVVESKAAANAALMQMQNCYPPDKRCFFTADNEANVASGALELAKLAWPRAFVTLDVRGKKNKLVPERPKLDDGCFFDFLRDTSLLALAASSPLALPDKVRYLFDHLKVVNDAVRKAGPPGKLSQAMFNSCSTTTSGCYLGYYRHDLNGVDLMSRLLHATDERSQLPADPSGCKPVVPSTAACPFRQ